jgi:hypothetical protein
MSNLDRINMETSRSLSNEMGANLKSSAHAENACNRSLSDVTAKNNDAVKNAKTE